jgi:hypothetical protein
MPPRTPIVRGGMLIFASPLRAKTGIPVPSIDRRKANASASIHKTHI